MYIEKGTADTEHSDWVFGYRNPTYDVLGLLFDVKKFPFVNCLLAFCLHPYSFCSLRLILLFICTLTVTKYITLLITKTVNRIKHSKLYRHFTLTKTKIVFEKEQRLFEKLYTNKMKNKSIYIFM